MEYKSIYKRWMYTTLSDPDLPAELAAIVGQENEIKDRFYRELEFGTGGLRGIIGVGSNRMNTYTVAKATQGYSNYLKTTFDTPTVAIAYDSRIKSQLFAQTAAGVFTANGIPVLIYPELMPTPALSFAVRHLVCSGGIVITASHNPGKYNGYKVYGPDGCQITLEVARKILVEINRTDVFDDVHTISFSDGLAQGLIRFIGEETVSAYLSAVSEQSLQRNSLDRNVSIVYTPLNGAGLRCVTQCLAANGFCNITMVESQCQPDGNFPTCPYPNPEMREALEEGLRCARQVGSDLLLATDPDCDRVGVAVRDRDDYTLISGNEMGILLFDYICRSRLETHTMPTHPVVVKTIVTTEMLRPIAVHYGVEIVDVLTGFKFIGEQIGLLEAQGRGQDYIFGFEESCGYLSGSFVRDKDAVNASLLICEMFAYYKTCGKSLLTVLDKLYQTYGFFHNSLQSFSFDGAEGFQTMYCIMSHLRAAPPAVSAGWALVSVSDYLTGQKTDCSGTRSTIDLPPSDVLKFEFDNSLMVVVRPSGTEPKLKIYYSVRGDSYESAQSTVQALKAEWNGHIATWLGGRQ